MESMVRRRRSRLKKGEWSEEEDLLLRKLVSEKGPNNWTKIAKSTARSANSCRHRWFNHLLRQIPFTDAEDEIILKAHAIHGNNWDSIANLLPGRTLNVIKDHWNSKFRDSTTQYQESIPLEMERSSQQTLVTQQQLAKSTQGKLINNHQPKSETVPVIQAHCPTQVTVFNHTDSPEIVSTPPCVGPSQVQPSHRDYSGISKLSDRWVPQRCGHGCCEIPGGVRQRNSFMGPEFIDFIEPPFSTTQELAALAADISNVAWYRSGLESSSIESMDNASCG